MLSEVVGVSSLSSKVSSIFSVSDSRLFTAAHVTLTILLRLLNSIELEDWCPWKQEKLAKNVLLRIIWLSVRIIMKTNWERFECWITLQVKLNHSASKYDRCFPHRSTTLLGLIEWCEGQFQSHSKVQVCICQFNDWDPRMIFWTHLIILDW